MSAVFSDEVYSENNLREHFRRFTELVKFNYDNTVGTERDSIIKSLNSYMFEPELRDKQGLLSNVLKSNINVISAGNYESYSIPFRDIILKRVIEELYNLSTREGESMTTSSLLSITGLSLDDILEMTTHEWRTIYSYLRVRKEALQESLDERMRLLEKEMHDKQK